MRSAEVESGVSSATMIFSLAGLFILEDARAMKLRAHAKVNLHLRVRGRRADGFHEIETLMAPISLADEITVTTSPGATVKVRATTRKSPRTTPTSRWRQRANFRDARACNSARDIEIRKRIPIGAGLGGGSSDAAAVLVALDTIFETHLGVEELEQARGKTGLGRAVLRPRNSRGLPRARRDHRALGYFPKG